MQYDGGCGVGTESCSEQGQGRGQPHEGNGQWEENAARGAHATCLLEKSVVRVGREAPVLSS